MFKRETLIQDSKKPIRSFISREGRKTRMVTENLRELWPTYGLSLQKSLDSSMVFGRSAPLTLEIGFGNGQSLLELACKHPEQDFIGVEVYKTGIARLIGEAAQRQLKNIRVYHADAIEVLTNCIPSRCLQAVHLFFPDPWPKARHHKRRLVQESFVELVASKVVPQGIFHMATDWENYAEHMLHVMEASPSWSNSVESGYYAIRPETRIMTKFERRGLLLGHGTWDLIFRNSPASNIL